MQPRAIDRRTFLNAALAAGATLGGLPGAARAASGKMLFGFPPGSVNGDIAAAVMKELQGSYEPLAGGELSHVSGAAGGRSVDQFLKAPADGATVMCNPSAVLTLMPAVRKMETADVLAQVIPVTPLAEFTLAFMVGPAVPETVRTMLDYVNWLRDSSTRVAYGMAGTGSASHMLGLSISRLTDLPLSAVNYQGYAPEMKDLLAGTLPAAIGMLGSDSAAMRAGGVRTLAVASDKRWPLAPELPTLSELGLSDLDLTSSLGLFLPAGTPADKVQQLAAAAQQAMRSPALRAFTESRFMRAPQGTPADYANTLRREREQWRKAVARERFAMQG